MMKRLLFVPLAAYAVLVAFAQPFPLGGDGMVYLAGIEHPGYLYPPLLAVLVHPLPLWAWMVFVGGNTVGLLLLYPRWFLFILFWPPLTISLYAGNVNITIALLYALALRYQSSGVLALGALLKIVPSVPLLVLLLRGHWKAPLCVFLLAFALFPHPLLWISTSVKALTTPIEHIHYSASLTAQLPSLPAAALSISLLAYTLWRARSLPMSYALCAAMLLPLLIARVTWSTHLVMVVPPLLYLWDKRPPLRPFIVATWLSGFIGAQSIPLFVLWLMATQCRASPQSASLPRSSRLSRPS